MNRLEESKVLVISPVGYSNTVVNMRAINTQGISDRVAMIDLSDPISTHGWLLELLGITEHQIKTLGKSLE